MTWSKEKIENMGTGMETKMYSHSAACDLWENHSVYLFGANVFPLSTACNIFGEELSRDFWKSVVSMLDCGQMCNIGEFKRMEERAGVDCGLGCFDNKAR